MIHFFGRIAPACILMRMATLCLLLIGSSVFSQNLPTSLKDADGNVLPKEMAVLMGESAPPQIPFRKPSAPNGRYATWKQEVGGGLCTDFYAECKSPKKHFGFDDVKLGTLHATVIREYLPDMTWTITDVLVRKRKTEASLAGNDCFQSQYQIPVNHHLVAIVDLTSTLAKGTRRLPANLLSPAKEKIWKASNIGQIPPERAIPTT